MNTHYYKIDRLRGLRFPSLFGGRVYMLECAACASKNLHVAHACTSVHAAAQYACRSLVRVSSVPQLLVRPLQCARTMPPRVLVPQLACCLVSSRCVSVCVAKMQSLREMDVVLAAMLVVCVRTLPSSRVRKIYLPCVYRVGPFFGAANNLHSLARVQFGVGAQRSGAPSCHRECGVGAQRSGAPRSPPNASPAQRGPRRDLNSALFTHVPGGFKQAKEQVRRGLDLSTILIPNLKYFDLLF